ncbi:MAG TPA: glycosyltransferase family 2 protein [Planctomycetota bacterium]|nr:glycosyltransferase family 2 protein [Planctomycetota bacterium]
MELAIVMPAYNESGCIEAVARAWAGVAEKTGGKLIVVNDGSRDDTGAILDRLKSELASLLVIHQSNAGHGSAIVRGYHEALANGARYVFQTDSDGQLLPEDFWKLWEQRGGHPFILGFREKRNDTGGRKIISSINRGLNTLLFGVRVRDPNVPFRLMRADLLREMLAMTPENVFAPNIFLSILAAKSRIGLLEISVTHLERKTGKVSIVGARLLKACFRTAWELVRFRWVLFRSGARMATLRARYAP